jgi:hypothetical protein
MRSMATATAKPRPQPSNPAHAHRLERRSAPKSPHSLPGLSISDCRSAWARAAAPAARRTRDDQHLPEVQHPQAEQCGGEVAVNAVPWMAATRRMVHRRQYQGQQRQPEQGGRRKSACCCAVQNHRRLAASDAAPDHNAEGRPSPMASMAWRVLRTSVGLFMAASGAAAPVFAPGANVVSSQPSSADITSADQMATRVAVVGAGQQARAQAGLAPVGSSATMAPTRPAAMPTRSAGKQERQRRRAGAASTSACQRDWRRRCASSRSR